MRSWKYTTASKGIRMTYLPRVHLKLLLAVFVLSGFAGLIYQSVWSHYLGLFLGHAAYAQALVLAIFMGGMAAGAALVARAGERWGNLVRTYAVIEAVIGFFALAFHWVFVGFLGLSYDVVIPALGQPGLVNAYKWALAALLILPQTVLLGMTFPLMSGGIIRRFPGSDGHVLGGLYFTNSIGAAVGVLFAAFLIMPRLGLDGAMMVAGLINLLVALLAWMLGRGNETVRKASPQTPTEQYDGSRNRLLRVVLFATFLSAAASFAYELIWIRMLSLAVGSTLHAFELMLASFIAGIAFGGLWVRRHADTHTDPMRLVGWMQVLMGLAALLSLALYANAFTWVGYLMEALARTDSSYQLFMLGTAAVSVAIMMPAAFFAGTTLPLFTVVLLRDGQGEGAIGRVYAWNTLGAIVGVFATIHFLIPATGLKLGLILAALVDITIGLVLLRVRVFEPRQFAHVGAASALALGAVVGALLWVDFDPMRLASGVYRSGQATLPDGTQVVYYKDGKTASVSATFNENGYASIATNGKSDASIGIVKTVAPTGDEPTMALLAALPLAYHDAPRTAAVIGFGSGLSTHTLLADKRLERVDTIEIEQAMIEGAQVFGERVSRAYRDPRSRVILDDAKSYFAGQQQRYDLIISEPSNPWISGVGSLFSKEFYHFVSHHHKIL
jgi:predicted membrane-bound spermidine synthase